MHALLRRLVRSEEGQDLIEYSLLVGIITVAAVLTIITIGGKVGAYFTNLNGMMP